MISRDCPQVARGLERSLVLEMPLEWRRSFVNSGLEKGQFGEGRLIVVAGPPGSGVTFVFQVLRALGFTVKAEHGYLFNKKAEAHFATFRDPRDLMCSYVRRQGLTTLQEKGMELALLEALDYLFEQKRFHEVLRSLLEAGATLIKYERFHPGKATHGLILMMARKLDLKLQLWLLEYLKWEFSMERNAFRAGLRKGFKDFDPKLHIHGGHVSNFGKVGGWRECFTPEVEEAVQKKLGGFMVEMGYLW